MSAPGNWKTAIANAFSLTFSATGQAIWSAGVKLGFISGTPDNPPASSALLYVTDAGVLRLRQPDGSDAAVGGGGGGTITTDANFTGDGSGGDPLALNTTLGLDYITSSIGGATVIDCQHALLKQFNGAGNTTLNWDTSSLIDPADGITVVATWANGFIEITGDITASGTITADGDITSNAGKFITSLDVVAGGELSGNTLLTVGNATIGGDITVNNIVSAQAYIANVTSIDDTDSPYPATTADSTILVDPATSSCTVLLPPVLPIGRIYVCKMIGTGTMIVDGNGANIDGAATLTVTVLNSFVTIQSDGSNWYIIGN